VSRPREERGATASNAERAAGAGREDLDEQIRREVDCWPPLTAAQGDRLALIFSGKATRLGWRAS
jgi:hypothetical protein